MQSWFERYYSHELLPEIVKWANWVVYWLTVSLCYKLGSWIPVGIGDAKGFGFILGLGAGFMAQKIYKGWILGWGYEGTWNEPPPGRD